MKDCIMKSNLKMNEIKETFVNKIILTKHRLFNNTFQKIFDKNRVLEMTDNVLHLINVTEQKIQLQQSTETI